MVRAGKDRWGTARWSTRTQSPPGSWAFRAYAGSGAVAITTTRFSPTKTRSRREAGSETAAELSDRTAAALSLGEDDTVVSTVGGPQFRLE